MTVEETLKGAASKALRGVLGETVTAHGYLGITKRTPGQAAPRSTTGRAIPAEEAAAAVTRRGIGQRVRNKVVAGLRGCHQAGQCAAQTTIDGHSRTITETCAGGAHLGADWENTAKSLTLRRVAHIEGFEDGAVMLAGITHLGCHDFTKHGQGVRPRASHVIGLVIGEDLRGVHEDESALWVHIRNSGKHAAHIKEHRGASTARHRGDHEDDRLGVTSIGVQLGLLVIQAVEFLDCFLGEHFIHRCLERLANLLKVRQGQHSADSAVLAGTISKLDVIGRRVSSSPSGDLTKLAGAAEDAGDSLVEGVVVLARTNADVLSAVLRHVGQLLRAGFLLKRHVDVDELPRLGQFGHVRVNAAQLCFELVHHERQGLGAGATATDDEELLHL